MTLEDLRKLLRRVSAALSVALVAVLVYVLLEGRREQAPPLLVAWLSSLALFFSSHGLLKRFAFTVWVLAFVAGSLFYPGAFDHWFGFDLGHLIVPLIQIIMFGMGTTLSLKDFGRVLTMPVPVLIGMFLQFSIMPLAGLAIATAFEFEPQVAAGVVLIGSCSGGVASNLMTYLAGGNVALSVTMTACSTLMSPLMTPFLMKVLAGQFVPIVFLDMMLNILNIVVVPVLAGLIGHWLLYSPRGSLSRTGPLAAIALTALALAALASLAPEASLGVFAKLRLGLVVTCSLVGVVALAKLVIQTALGFRGNWMDRTLPVVSMSGICFIIAIITARASEKLISVGLALIAAAVIHNLLGYVLGYWLARAARLEESTCRTIAFEVGMQNGGMASGLAMSVLKSANVALAPAIFGPWMNVSGSVLATWWRRRPPGARGTFRRKKEELHDEPT